MAAGQPGGQIGVEVDEAARVATVVYFGAVTDQQVVSFYRTLIDETPAVAQYDFLIDLRHTLYVPTAETIAAVGQIARDHNRAMGRIAAVRRDRADVYMATAGARMLEEFGRDRMRFFDSIEAARAWLTQDK